MPYTITIGYPKGGSCKSHTSTNLAAVAGAHGLKTLLIDLDIIGGSSLYFGVPETSDKIASRMFSDDEEITASELITPTPNGFDGIIAGPDLLRAQKWITDDAMGVLELRRLLEQDPVIQTYDLIIIDTPPMTGGLLTAAMYASDAIISPLRTNEDDLRPLPLYIDQFEYINKKRKKFGLPLLIQLCYVITDFEMNRKISKNLLESLYATLDPEEISPIKIPHGEAHRRAGGEGKPVVILEPKARISVAWNMFFNEHIAPLFPDLETQSITVTSPNPVSA